MMQIHDLSIYSYVVIVTQEQNQQLFLKIDLFILP